MFEIKEPHPLLSMQDLHCPVLCACSKSDFISLVVVCFIFLLLVLFLNYFKFFSMKATNFILNGKKG